MVEIPLGRGCICLVNKEEIKRMLLQEQNQQLFVEGVKKGKGLMRYKQMVKREKKKEMV